MSLGGLCGHERKDSPSLNLLPLGGSPPCEPGCEVSVHGRRYELVSVDSAPLACALSISEAT